MIQITIEFREFWDEVNEIFVKPPFDKPITLTLEHSLISISKWEAKWHKSFLNTEEKTIEETYDYFRCMTIEQHIDPIVYRYMSKTDMERIEEYIKNPMTATTFGGNRNSKKTNKYNSEIITSELVYAWMVELRIPSQYEKWHINRLITLIQVLSIRQDEAMNKDKKSKRMTSDQLDERKRLNEERKKALHTKG